MFANVMSCASMSRRVPGLTLDVERDPKSKRVISVITNASPSLEAFILSIVSNHDFRDLMY
jgi:hypothetical protein